MGCKNSKADKVENPVYDGDQPHMPHHEHHNDEDAGHVNQEDVVTDTEVLKVTVAGEADGEADLNENDPNYVGERNEKKEN